METGPPPFPQQGGLVAAPLFVVLTGHGPLFISIADIGAVIGSLCPSIRLTVIIAQSITVESIGRGGGGPSFPLPRFTWARSISTKSDVMQAPPPTEGSESDFSTEVSGQEYGNRQESPPTPPMPSSPDIERYPPPPLCIIMVV